MDLAKIAELLGSKTEGDPAFQDTEESQFFVHLLRMDDVDNRAAAMRQPVDPAEQPEASDEQVQEITEAAAALTSSGDDTVVEPAATTSANVAPEAEPSQALFSEGPEASANLSEPDPGSDAEPSAMGSDDTDAATPADLFREDGPDVSPSTPVQEPGADAEPAVSESDGGPEPQAPDVFREDGQDAEPVNQQADPGAEASPAVAQAESGQDASPPEIFQQTGPEAEAARTPPPEEFLEVSTQTARGETTMVVPQTLMDAGFMDVLQRFDATVRIPEIQLGEVPPATMMEELDAESVQSSTEGAEQMLTGLSRNMVQWERRA
jgi:hypothetical protein